MGKAILTKMEANWILKWMVILMLLVDSKAILS